MFSRYINFDEKCFLVKSANLYIIYGLSIIPGIGNIWYILNNRHHLTIKNTVKSWDTPSCFVFDLIYNKSSLLTLQRRPFQNICYLLFNFAGHKNVLILYYSFVLEISQTFSLFLIGWWFLSFQRHHDNNINQRPAALLHKWPLQSIEMSKKSMWRIF